MTRTKPTVLVVNDDPIDREQIAGWIEAEGFEVIACPGPREPGYICLGGRGVECPLANEADVVVLDMHLASDEVMEGTPGWDLLLFYMARGANVVALSGVEDPVHPRVDRGVAVLQRPADRTDIVDAVRTFTDVPDTRERGE